jgi:hypothetical protein
MIAAIDDTVNKTGEVRSDGDEMKVIWEMSVKIKYVIGLRCLGDFRGELVSQSPMNDNCPF